MAASVGALLQQIESRNPEDVDRDSAGNVVSVALRQGWANDRNLTLLSTVGSLRRLGIEPIRRAEPTQFGIASLGGLTNLESLRLACSGPLPEGVFRAICNLGQLRSVRLTAVYPPVGEYHNITNLQNLAELHVAYCTNFTDEQLALITNLPNLRSIELRANGLSRQATNFLAGMGALTNVVIKPSERLKP